MTTLVRLPIEILTQIIQDLFDQNGFNAIRNLGNTCHGFRNFIIAEFARRLRNSFRNGRSYVEALRQPRQDPIRVSPPLFDPVDGEFLFSGEYPLDVVWSMGLRVAIVFENIHYSLSPQQLPAYNICYTDPQFTDYNCLVEIGPNEGPIPRIFRRRMYVWVSFSGSGANSTLDMVRFKLRDIFGFVDSV